MMGSRLDFLKRVAFKIKLPPTVRALVLWFWLAPDSRDVGTKPQAQKRLTVSNLSCQKIRLCKWDKMPNDCGVIEMP